MIEASFPAESTAQLAQMTWQELLAGPVLRIGVILLLAVLARQLLVVVLRKVTERIATGGEDDDRPDASRRRPSRLRLFPPPPGLVDPVSAERRAQRAGAVGTVLRSVITTVIFVVAGLMVLAEVGISIAPLLASAGIAGVALGIGAQSLVKDYLNGLFMVFEDQYGVGDVITLGENTGVVEAVGLRVTRLRDVDGTVWYVRNGEIYRVGNQSHGWTRAVLDVSVPYDTDLDQLEELLGKVGEEFVADPAWSAQVVEPPELWGVEEMGADALVVRMVVRTRPLKKSEVARELRVRIRRALDDAGIRLSLPGQSLWIHEGNLGRPNGTSGQESRA